MVTKCEHCQAVFEVADEKVFQNVKCPSCGGSFQAMPSAEPPPTAAPPPPAADAAAQPAPPAPPVPPPAAKARRAVAFVSPIARRNLAVIFLVATVALAAASVWDSVLDVDLVTRALAGEEVTDAEAQASDERGAMIALPYLAAIIGALVFFLLWEYRAYKNLRPLAARQIRFSPGGSVGWYFCPIANLWKPCQAMLDIWKGSRGAGGAFVMLWWLFWIGDLILGQVSSRMSWALDSRASPSLHQVMAMLRVSIASDIVGIASAVLTMCLVWTVSNAQLRRREAMASPETDRPADPPAGLP